MNAKEYADKIGIGKLSELEKAKLLMFYHYKTYGQICFSMKEISDILVEFGQSKPNTSRLRKKLLDTEYFRADEGNPRQIRFTNMGLDSLNDEQSSWWEDVQTIESNSELIDEEKFCGIRGYLDSLIRQINHSYSSNCYDAAAVLMRRLFEILLIQSYQAHGIDDQIKDPRGVGYQMLEKIVANAKSNQILKLSRVKNKFDEFRNIGNSSAHNIFYLASKKDIDDIKHDYRVALEELYNKSGLM